MATGQVMIDPMTGERISAPATIDPATGERVNQAAPEALAPPQKSEREARLDMGVERSESLFPRATRALKTVFYPMAWAGEKIERMGGAPTRSAIAALQEGQGLGGAVNAFSEQFLDSPDLAPTGKQIAERAGLSGEGRTAGIPGMMGFGASYNQDGTPGFSPAGMVGLGIDLLADPTNFIPGAPVVKGATKATGTTMKVAGKAAGKGVSLGAGVAAKAADIATGTKGGTKILEAAKAGLKGLEGGYSSVSEALKSRFGANLAPDFEKSLKVAERNKIDPNLLPESVMFGPNSSASRMARVKAEGPLGKELLDRHQAATQAVQDALRRDIRTIGGEVLDDAGKVISEANIPPNAYSAGELIKKSYDDGVDRAFSEIGETHNSIIKNNPGLKIDPGEWGKLNESLSELESYAKKRSKTGITNSQKEQGRQLLNAIENIKENSKTYSGMVDALRDIGDVAFKSKNVLADIPPDIQRFRKLYGDLNEALVGTVKINEPYIGQGAAASLRKSNKAISEMYGDKSLLSMLGDEGKSPERLFKGLIIEGDAKRIEALKKYLTPEQLQQVKAAALSTMIKESPQGDFTYRALHNALRTKKDVFGALFSPGELQNFNDLIQLGDKLGPAVMSSSGTGASNSFSKLISTPLDMAEKALDATAAVKQKKAAARAIGFETLGPQKTATKKGGRPPTMSFGEIGAARYLTPRNPRAKASQLYYLQTREDEE